jgi:hypothetical protein
MVVDIFALFKNIFEIHFKFNNEDRIQEGTLVFVLRAGKVSGCSRSNIIVVINRKGSVDENNRKLLPIQNV